MNCEEAKINLPGYIDGKLDPHEAGETERHLERCTSCRELYSEMRAFLSFTDGLPPIEPPAGMTDDFLRRVAQEPNPIVPKTRTLPMWMKVAAMLLIVCATYWFGYRNGSLKGEAETAVLADELSQSKQDVLLASLHEHTGPQKIEAVYAVSNSGHSSNKLIDALVYTMNSDKNVNVRLAAINALAGMIGKSDRVKGELIKSLGLQENPLLQISLIQVLTESGVKEAKDEIESITRSDKADERVKALAKDMVKIII